MPKEYEDVANDYHALLYREVTLRKARDAKVE